MCFQPISKLLVTRSVHHAHSWHSQLLVYQQSQIKKTKASECHQNYRAFFFADPSNQFGSSFLRLCSFEIIQHLFGNTPWQSSAVDTHSMKRGPRDRDGNALLAYHLRHQPYSSLDIDPLHFSRHSKAASPVNKGHFSASAKASANRSLRPGLT